MHRRQSLQWLLLAKHSVYMLTPPHKAQNKIINSVSVTICFIAHVVLDKLETILILVTKSVLPLFFALWFHATSCMHIHATETWLIVMIVALVLLHSLAMGDLLHLPVNHWISAKAEYQKRTLILWSPQFQLHFIHLKWDFSLCLIKCVNPHSPSH